VSLFPRIERSCPYVDRLDAVITDDFCRMCRRAVHDLTDMDDAARAAFLASCSGETCVRYRVPQRAVLATAAALATVAIADTVATGVDRTLDSAGDVSRVQFAGLIAVSGYNFEDRHSHPNVRGAPRGAKQVKPRAGLIGDTV